MGCTEEGVYGIGIVRAIFKMQEDPFHFLQPFMSFSYESLKELIDIGAHLFCPLNTTTSS
jgi:hypothetical protein